MKTRRNEEDGEHENSERWLLTYSDLITLLLALFIILYTMSSLDLEKMKQLSQNLSAAFNNSDVSNENSNVPSSDGGTGLADNSSGGGTETSETGYNNNSSIASNPLDEIYNELSKYISENNLESTIGLENAGNYVRISLKDVVLFVPDRAKMLEDSKPILLEIEKALSDVYTNVDHITISGNTANPPNDTNYSSDFAWQLSADRALAVLKYMVGCGLQEDKLSIEGNSHYNPVSDNSTSEGRAKNRRVEITISKGELKN